MFESVCSGRRTKFVKRKAATSAAAASRRTTVQRVNGERSIRQHRITSRMNDGSQISRARKNTRCSKFSLNFWVRFTVAAGVLGSEAILFDPTVEAPATESERFGRMTYVASMTRQRLPDQKGFYLFQAHLLDRTGAISRLQRKIFRPDVLAGAHQYRAFDRVIEFAHVSGPGILQQIFHGCG